MPPPSPSAPTGRERRLVAAGHPAVVAAAHEVLDAGGNAFDAVVAAGFAGAVAEPALTSLAGGGFCLVRTAAGEEVLVDFFVDTPGLGLAVPPVPHFEEVVVAFEVATQAFHCGPGSIAVPGCLPGYLHVHERFGRLDLAAVAAPAVRLARDGVDLLPRQAGILALLEQIVLRTPAGRALFAPSGRLVAAGDRLRNPELGDVLAELGRGGDVRFSAGPLADALLSLTAADGLVTAEDLAAYRVVERDPLEVPWRGRRVLTNPGPSFGGTLVAAALARLDEADLPPGDPRWPARLAATAAEVDAHRRAILSGRDPRDRPTRHRPDLPPREGREGPGPPGAGPPEPDPSGPGPGPGSAPTSSSGARRVDGPSILHPGRPGSARGTTHVSVWDGEGGAASMTTSNGECSGDVIPGTGILTNNVLGEDDLHPDGFHAAPPGLRVASMMAPTVVVGPDGATEVVVGSGGSKRIRAAVTQVLANVLVHGLDPRAAVEAPRVHWDVDHVEAEPGLSPEALAALAEVGPVNAWPGLSMYFGGAHVVAPGLGAAGDPRRDGAASP